MLASRTIAAYTVACASGLALSLIIFLSTASMNFGSLDIGGQLIAGDKAANSQLPTTLNALSASVNGQNAMVQSLGDYGWWIGVIASAAVFALIILRMGKRLMR